MANMAKAFYEIYKLFTILKSSCGGTVHHVRVHACPSVSFFRLLQVKQIEAWRFLVCILQNNDK